ncbi:MAG: type I-U CRISPR-associated RAMP protein Csb1/Cas7u [Pseudomonadota bacterium]
MAEVATRFPELEHAPRVLLESDLQPTQGHRFQATGFPDLGPARYQAPDGTEMLLVESAQSVANRMEAVCWDPVEKKLIKDLSGVPYVSVVRSDSSELTNSILEAHRINSEYIMYDKSPLRTAFESEIDYKKDAPVDWHKFYRALFKYDPNSLIHGCFLEEIAGRLRVPRALTGFIEASTVGAVESGGVKFNIVQPHLKEGKGHVPYHRTEFTASRITAYFNLDLELIRSFSLGIHATDFLIALSFFKITRFLDEGLRLRTACDLQKVDGQRITAPKDFTIPDESNLRAIVKDMIAACKSKQLFHPDGVFAVPVKN